jgi:hypothetical protein
MELLGPVSATMAVAVDADGRGMTGQGGLLGVDAGPQSYTAGKTSG